MYFFLATQKRGEIRIFLRRAVSSGQVSPLSSVTAPSFHEHHIPTSSDETISIDDSLMEEDNDVNVDTAVVGGTNSPDSLSSEDEDEHKKHFYILVEAHLSESKGDTTMPFTKKAMENRKIVLREFKKGKMKPGQLKSIHSQAPLYIKQFDLIQLSHQPERLVFIEEYGVALSNYKSVCCVDDAYDAIKGIHIYGHIKRGTLKDKCNLLFGRSIPLWICVAFGNTYPVCNRRNTRTRVKAGHMPSVPFGFGQRGQVDLIDLQSLDINKC